MHGRNEVHATSLEKDRRFKIDEIYKSNYKYDHDPGDPLLSDIYFTSISEQMPVLPHLLDLFYSGITEIWCP